MPRCAEEHDGIVKLRRRDAVHAPGFGRLRGHFRDRGLLPVQLVGGKGDEQSEHDGWVVAGKMAGSRGVPARVVREHCDDRTTCRACDA